jgi:uncharacterized membrane protein
MIELSINQKKSLKVCALIGIGFMAALDEVIFHQILGWHHFYDRSTPTIGLISDGFLHSFELIAIVSGFFLFSTLRKEGDLVPKAAWAGFFIGLGIFQLFDGIVDHKVLRLHQIRYGVESIIPYDITWNLVGVIFLAIGWMLTKQLDKEKA